MSEVPNSSYASWLQKAEEDEYAGRDILTGRHFAAPACFHFQQMVEKLLKALLIFYNQNPPKIHDLIVLAAFVESIDPTIKEYKTDLEFLDRYLVETRYPGDYPEFTFGECEDAFAAALRIKEFILSKIKSVENSGFGLIGILVTVALIALIAGGGWFAVKKEGQQQQSLVQFSKEQEQKAQQLKQQIEQQNQETEQFLNGSTSKTTTTTVASIFTQDWKTYRSSKYGFEVKYPQDMAVKFSSPPTSIKSAVAIFNIYDPAYTPSEGAVGQDIRVESRGLQMTIYSFSPERLDAMKTSNFKTDEKIGEHVWEQKNIKIGNGTIEAYIMNSGLIGPYFSALIYNNAYILDTYSTYGDNGSLAQSILSTFKFSK